MSTSADYAEPRLCSGCQGQGIIPTPDGEDAFECSVCDGSGLARAIPWWCSAADPLPYGDDE